MEVARLYESPFTDTAPQGPEMIFTENFRANGRYVTRTPVVRHMAARARSVLFV